MLAGFILEFECQGMGGRVWGGGGWYSEGVETLTVLSYRKFFMQSVSVPTTPAE